MITIKLIFADVTWQDIEQHPILPDWYRNEIHFLQFFLIPYNELQEKTCWNIFKWMYKALKELEKGKPCKKASKRFELSWSTLFTCKKSRDEIFEAFSKTPFRHYKTKKSEVCTFEKVDQMWLKWFNIRK